jgi:hypothetical protein
MLLETGDSQMQPVSRTPRVAPAELKPGSGGPKSSVAGGAVIANGVVYRGSGYSKAGLTGNQKIYGFTVSGK